MLDCCHRRRYNLLTRRSSTLLSRLHLDCTVSVSIVLTLTRTLLTSHTEPTVDGTYITNILGTPSLGAGSTPLTSSCQHARQRRIPIHTTGGNPLLCPQNVHEDILSSRSPPHSSAISPTPFAHQFTTAPNILTPFAQLHPLISEIVIACSYISIAKGNNTYNCRFSIWPTRYRGDIPYAFWMQTTQPMVLLQMWAQRWICRDTSLLLLSPGIRMRSRNRPGY
jgi:hypothetical protein